ncbi:MAG: cytochrome c [Bacillota bacterium]|nr:cytochrome c [Bacillota bacterium]
MKQFFAFSVLILLFLSGCSSGNSNTAMDGQSLYKKTCASCHGENLQGAVGPTLVNIKSKYSEADIEKIISKGSQHMPANLLDSEDSKIVAKWLLTK